VAPTVPVIVTGVATFTPAVEMANVAELEPAGTVTEAGSVAAELLDVSLTTTPDEAAAPVRVTVPVLPLPPITEVGLTETLATVGALITNVAD